VVVADRPAFSQRWQPTSASPRASPWPAATYSGRITGKLMVVDNLVDVDAPATAAN
jgi:hypothetical protein